MTTKESVQRKRAKPVVSSIGPPSPHALNSGPPPNALSSSLNRTYNKAPSSLSSNPPTPATTPPPPTNASTKSTHNNMISLRFSDVGGIEAHLQSIKEICIYPLTHPEVFKELGVRPPRGVLLHGVPGCGKTLLAHAIAGELQVPFFKLSAPEIVSGMSGESEDKIRKLFAQARACAPSIIFIDELDAIAAKREGSSKGMELRIVSQLLTCMDGEGGGGSLEENGGGGDSVLVIGATNRPDSLDSALRRPGRFDREIHLGIPTETGRLSVLKVLIGKLKMDESVDLPLLANRTHGFVGADLQSLVKEAAILAVNRIFVDLPDRPLTGEELAPLQLEQGDFLLALSKVQPSLLREGFAQIPQVTWEDIGALEETRLEMERNIILPLKHASKFRAFNMSLSSGILLFGPPGCGKTLLAKATANASGANFISVKGPELLNKYVGESESAIRQVFKFAKNAKPCVIFFDEFDALCPKRAGGASVSSEEGVSTRVVNQLLTEMDSITSEDSIFVIGATNRPESIDPAMIRFGRLHRLCFVNVPTERERVLILQALSRKTPLAPDVDLERVVAKLDGFTGADLASLLREASMHALQLQMDNTNESSSSLVRQSDFDFAQTRIRASVSELDLLHYARTAKLLNSLAKN